MYLNIYPSLVLVQPRKTRPCLTERLLMINVEEINWCTAKALTLGAMLYAYVSLALQTH